MDEETRQKLAELNDKIERCEDRLNKQALNRACGLLRGMDILRESLIEATREERMLKNGKVQP